MNITLNSRLSISSIEIHFDQKHYILEDVSSGEFYEMPKICIEAIQLIQSGERLGEIERILKHKYPSEEVDILDFVQQLQSLQLISEIDGEKVEVSKKNNESLGFLWISPQVGKFFFHKIGLLIYSVLFMMNIIIFLTHPALFPHYKDLFLFKFMFLNIPVWMVVTSCLVIIHEFGHVLAMRAFNLPTRMGVGHRLFLVVFETDLSAAWKLPSKKRNVLYLAGLCFDTSLLFLALAGQLVFPDNSPVFTGILRMVVLDTFIRMVYQCCVYMKTDLYYVLENSTGCYNLMENAQQYISKLIPFRKKTMPEEVMFPGEKRMVFCYSIFYCIGVGITLFLFAVYYIPQLVFAMRKVWPGFSEGLSTTRFWDATLFSIQLLVGILLLLNSWRKKYQV